MEKVVSLLVLSLVLALLLSAQAMATGLDVTGVALDTAPVFTVAALVFTALGSLWAIRKVIKTINKS
jgi:hypothetical protein